MSADPQRLDAVIRAVRACFQRLGAAANEMHKDLGVTASMRAVMESLAEGGAQTVPGIARAKSVSRQHIQVIVDALAAAGHVGLRDNPAHKRSPLVELTESGASVYGSVRIREAAALRELAGVLANRDMDAALRVLSTISNYLEPSTDKGDNHD